MRSFVICATFVAFCLVSCSSPQTVKYLHKADNKYESDAESEYFNKTYKNTPEEDAENEFCKEVKIEFDKNAGKFCLGETKCFKKKTGKCKCKCTNMPKEKMEKQIAKTVGKKKYPWDALDVILPVVGGIFTVGGILDVAGVYTDNFSIEEIPYLKYPMFENRPTDMGIMCWTVGLSAFAIHLFKWIGYKAGWWYD